MNPGILDIYKIFLNEYGPQGWWPVYSLRNTGGRDNRGYFTSVVPSGASRSRLLQESSKFEIAVGAILTQNTAWTNVEKAIDKLVTLEFMDPEIILDISMDELTDAIRSSGYYNQKAKKLKILAEFLLEGGFTEDGNAPKRDDLLGLWGIGAETADSILLYVFRTPVFVVDTYTRRIFMRLGLLNGNEQYNEIAKHFTDNLAKDSELYQEYHALIVKHAKEHCRKKPLCDDCVLSLQCSFFMNNHFAA